MPRIKVLEAVAGADFAWAPGDVVEMDEDAAAAWADGHRAVLADDEPGDTGGLPAAVHEEPLVVDEDGQPLEVLAATLEELPATDGVTDGPRWVRWSVTVRLPRPAADGDQAPASADVTGPDGAQAEQEAGEPELFDPSAHSNREVLAYLDGVGEAEALRVLDAEAAGQNRSGIAKAREQVLAAARERDAAAGGQPPAAETREW
ncbi:hypothetical protein [Streptomyces griseosporeus]|uniref:hypothetical protein n=1 Tax=Streptomyces griseosporeus TaxID=1910 RepID=UPI003701CC08